MFGRTGMAFPFLYTLKVARDNINFNHFEESPGPLINFTKNNRPLNFTQKDKLNEAMTICGK